MPATVTTKNVVEQWVTFPGGVEFYTKTWKANSEPPVATVVFVHGFGEHVNRYDHVFDKFQGNGIEVFAYDQRGFGQTAARNKNPGVTSWKLATEDITHALRLRRREGVPQFLFGHSMGGALAVNYATEGPERDNVAGFLISAPFLDQPASTKPSQSIVYLGTAVSKVLPSFQIGVKFFPEYTSRVPEEVKKYEDDPLIHSIGSLGGIRDMLLGPKAVLKSKYKNITKPIYMVHGDDDKITCCKTSKELFDKIPSSDKTFREWKGGYHELHNDLEKDEVIIEWIEWILKRKYF
ncbi:9632_t:CDS:2 [Ambispora gerdemannii]|uniref:9632_t:CDS:1 n=1 Tax=Ambispora gerdemannii TaxID=144530 RepID=A0A9N9BWP8_9GLOM|nr:9632_t:CDS:2 [Ambispora gerdemannii]